MARKRQIQVEKRIETEIIEEYVPEKYKDVSWSDWFKGTYAKWWFIILSISFDLILALEISRHLTGIWSYFLPIMVFIALGMVELYIFHRVWGGLDFLFSNRKFI